MFQINVTPYCCCCCCCCCSFKSEFKRYFFCCSLINRHHSSWLLVYLAAITLRAAAEERDVDLTSMLIVSFAFYYEMIQAEHTAVFVPATEEHALWAQYDGWQDRKISFYWQHLIWPQFTDVLLKLLVIWTVSALVWLAPVAEAKWSPSEKSSVLCGRKDALHLNKCNSCQEKRQKQQLWTCVWGGQP